MTSVVGLESARVGVFCGSGDIATTPNGLFDLSGATTFSNTLLVLLHDQQSPSSF